MGSWAVPVFAGCFEWIRDSGMVANLGVNDMSAEALSSLGELFSHPAVGAEGIEVARGELLFEQGSTAEHLYCIHRGQVRLYQVGPNGEERLVEILGAGQWCGCAALSE